MTPRERQKELIDSYSVIEDPVERFQVIVDGAAAKPCQFPEEHRVEENLVPGCQSKVWLVGWLDGESGLLELRMDSDAPALKGVVGLFEEVYNAASPSEVIDVEPDFLKELGIDRILTPTRRRGLGFVRERLVKIAREHG